MSQTLLVNTRHARRLVVSRQRLAGPRPAGGIDAARSVLRSLRCVQLDPINVVARSHLLIMWIRLGVNPEPHLDELLWRERWLFEYWAHAASLVLTEDYPIHAANMAIFPPVESNYGRRVEAWLAANDKLRKHILSTLRKSGPLPPARSTTMPRSAGNPAAGPTAAAWSGCWSSYGGAGR